MRHLLTSNAFRFCMAVNCVVVSAWLAIDAFNASPFAEVEDWGVFILFMLTLGRGLA